MGNLNRISMNFCESVNARINERGDVRDLGGGFEDGGDKSNGRTSVPCEISR